MTDQNFVHSHYSKAQAQRNSRRSLHTYHGSDKWSIIVVGFSGVLGNGSNEEEAWKDAAERIRNKELFWTGDGRRLLEKFKKT